MAKTILCFEDEEYKLKPILGSCIHCGTKLKPTDNSPSCQDIESCTARKQPVELEEGAIF